MEEEEAAEWAIVLPETAMEGNTEHATLITFVALTILCTAVGIFFCLWNERNRRIPNVCTTERDNSTLIVAMSLSSTSTSLYYLSWLQSPSDGVSVLLEITSDGIAGLISAIFVLPLLYRIDVYTTSQVLERRFNSGCIFYLSVLWNIILAITSSLIVLTYTVPMLGLMCRLPPWLILVLAMLCVVLYITLGGFKAVIWCESIQFCMVLLCTFSFLVTVGPKSSKSLSGWARTDLYPAEKVFSPEVLKGGPRFWWKVVPGFVHHFKEYGLNQPTLQRAAVVGSARQAKCCVILQLLFSMTLLLMLHIALYYADGHIMLLLMEDPKLQVLISLAVFTSVVSSLSAQVTSLAAVLYSDTPVQSIRQCFCKHCGHLSLQRILIVTLAVILLGCSLLLLSLPVGFLSVAQPAAMLNFALDEPISIALLSSLIVPIINWIGALCGLVSAFTTRLLLDILALDMGPSMSGATNLNVSHSSSVSWNDSQSVPPTRPSDSTIRLHHLDTDFVKLLIVIVYFIAAVVSSSLTGGCKKPNTSSETSTCSPQTNQHHTVDISSIDDIPEATSM